MSTAVENRTYQTSQAIVFHKTNERFGGLSNMAPGCPLQINNQTIRTAEAFYQACRYPHLPEVQQEIIRLNSPITAKRYARKYITETRADWDKVRISIMRWSLKAKLLQNQKTFGELLLATKNLPIVEYSEKDDFWGAGPAENNLLTGRNVLGRLLMELREQYKTGQINLNYLPPLAINGFYLLGKPIEGLQPIEEKYNIQPQLLAASVYV